MFFTLCKARLKILLRTKSLVFWSLFFPIILSVFFHLAFSNLDNGADIETIKVALIGGEEQKILLETMNTVTDENDKHMFKAVLMDKDKAIKALKDETIAAYIEGDSLNLHLRNKGIEENVLFQFLKTYKHQTSMIEQIIKDDPSKLSQIDFTGMNKSYIEEKDFGKKKLKASYSYFYSLFAMACMYGAFWGSRCVSETQGDQSDLAARLCASPTPKGTLILADILICIMLLFSESIILLTYLNLAYGIEFGSNIPYILLTNFCGCMLATSFGYFISSMFKKSVGFKESMIIGITMLCSAFTGIFGTLQVKYIIEQNIPFLNKINPTALITDCLYQLQNFNNHDKFFQNIGCMLMLTAFFGVISYLKLRRKRYASL